MSIVRTLIGNIKGPAGATGATGATGAAGANGADGAAATVNVGTVSTTAYGNPAQVINSGTESAAVLDFVIPQGQPGEEVTDMAGLTLGTMTTQTAQFPTPQIGDNGATLFGKIVKYFSDLRTLIGTKLNTSNVVNNFTTTESGYALDARAGKTLNDSLTSFVGGRSYIITSLPRSGTLRLNVSGSARLKVWGFTSNASSGFEYWFGVYGSAAQMVAIEVVKNTSVTYSISNGVITFSNSGNFDDQVYVEVLVGAVSVVS